MNYLFYFLLFFLLTCAVKSPAAPVEAIDYELVSRFSFPVIKGNTMVLNSQEKIDDLYKTVRRHSQGNRYPPIPVYSEEETYIVIKAEENAYNPAAITKIELGNDTLLVFIRRDSTLKKSTLEFRYILLKLNKKINDPVLKIIDQKI